MLPQRRPDLVPIAVTQAADLAEGQREGHRHASQSHLRLPALFRIALRPPAEMRSVLRFLRRRTSSPAPSPISSTPRSAVALSLDERAIPSRLVATTWPRPL